MKIVNLPVSLPELENNTPPYLSRPVPAYSFPLHLLCSVIGGRGSGKTTFALRLVKLYDKCKTFDRIILFSTTAHKEEKMRDFLKSKTFAELTHYKTYRAEDLQNEMTRMEGDIEAYRHYKYRLEIWNKFVKNHYDEEKMSVDELIVLDEMNFEPPEPPNKSGLYPCHLVIFDDLVGKKVFNANLSGIANNFLISHRHYSSSVMILSQSFTNFIPKQIRSNNIGLWILFGTKCEKTMKDIADDVASKVSPDQFVEAWKYATSKPYTPLICDYDTTDDNKRFRVGINKLLLVSNDELITQKIEK
jgi:hypothetical protein